MTSATRVSDPVEQERLRVMSRFVFGLFIVAFTVLTTWIAWKGAWPLAPFGALGVCVYSVWFTKTGGPDK